MNFVTTLLLCFGFGPEASGASQMALAVKNPLANAGDWVSIPGWGRSPGGGDDNPLQYSCLENPWTEEPMDSGLQAIGSQRVKQLSDLARMQILKPPPGRRS